MGAKAVFLTSALKKKGVKELGHFLLQLAADPSNRKDSQTQQTFYLKKWLQQEYGLFGLAQFDTLISARLSSLQSYEQKEQAIVELMRTLIPSLQAPAS